MDELIPKNDNNEKLTSEVIEKIENKLHDYCLNSIGNIVLLDSHVNEKGYIVPGLGDAGDRIFGTK